MQEQVVALRAFDQLLVDLVVLECGLTRQLLGLEAHACPDIRIDHIRVLYGFLRAAGNHDHRSGLLGNLARFRNDSLIRLIAFRSGNGHMHA
ncbi:hypothetical protein D3C74_464200 [compost metagenome]